MSTDYNSFDVLNEALKNEETFFPSAFTNSFKYTDLQALALKIQDLLLMEKGTNPSAMAMGVGIKNYLFEFLDDATIAILTEEITYQQQTFIPNNLIRNFQFFRNNLENSERNKLYLFIYLNKNDEYEEEYFAIDVSINNDSSNTINSDIYI